MNVANLLEYVSEGSSLAEAIDAGLARFQCARTDLETEILQTPRSGFLGWFGSRPARIRLRLTSRVLVAERITAHLISLCGFSAELSSVVRGNRLEIQLNSADSALLIGRHGQGIDALQQLVNTLLDQALGRGLRVEIDCDGYRSRRVDSLHRLARSLINRVRKSGHPATTPPLDSESRQLLNRLLEQEDGLSTRAVGQGSEKKLVVSSRMR